MDESLVPSTERLGKCQARVWFSIIAYNMKRAISIKGTRALVEFP